MPLDQLTCIYIETIAAILVPSSNVAKNLSIVTLTRKLSVISSL